MLRFRRHVVLYQSIHRKCVRSKCLKIALQYFKIVTANYILRFWWGGPDIRILQPIRGRLTMHSFILCYFIIKKLTCIVHAVYLTVCTIHVMYYTCHVLYMPCTLHAMYYTCHVLYMSCTIHVMYYTCPVLYMSCTIHVMYYTCHVLYMSCTIHVMYYTCQYTIRLENESFGNRHASRRSV